jgi:Uncharacterized conserved protein
MSAGDDGNPKQYLIVIEKSETNFSAYSPDLPGCVATGKTRQEAEEQMCQAIAFHLEGLEEDGMKGVSED